MGTLVGGGQTTFLWAAVSLNWESEPHNTSRVFGEVLSLWILTFTESKVGPLVLMACICEQEERVRVVTGCLLRPVLRQTNIMYCLLQSACIYPAPQSQLLWLWSHPDLRWNPSLVTYRLFQGGRGRCTFGKTERKETEIFSRNRDFLLEVERKGGFPSFQCSKLSTGP